MDTQQKFKELMEKITGRQLDERMGEAVSRKALEDNCREMQALLMPMLSIDIEKGNEPLPFCYSGSNREAELVWVGLNPGEPIPRGKKWSWDKACWDDIVNYCVPQKDISRDCTDTTYETFLNDSKSDLETDYYRFVLRMHMALLGSDEVYDTWNEVKNKCKKNLNKGDDKENTTAKLFLNRFSKKPVLAAELIPYKSKGMQFSAKALLKNDNYMEYFRTLLKFIEGISKPNAWIIFFGAPREVRILLEREYPQLDIHNIIREKKIPDENGQAFQFLHIKKHPVLLSPFIKRYHVNYRIKDLIKCMKDYETELANNQ